MVARRGGVPLRYRETKSRDHVDCRGADSARCLDL